MKKRRPIKECVICGATFRYSKSNKFTCCREHSVEYKRRQAQMQAPWRYVLRVCANVGCCIEFYPRHESQIYHHHACATKVNNKNRSEEHYKKQTTTLVNTLAAKRNEIISKKHTEGVFRCEYGCNQLGKYALLRVNKLCCSAKSDKCPSQAKKISTNKKPNVKPSKPNKKFNCLECNKPICKNTSGLCQSCYLDTDKANEQRGKTFSKHRVYRTDPRTNTVFYLMSYLEEEFFDLCLSRSIKLEKAKPIRYLDSTGKQHRYYPDFYLPQYDQVIEIKGFLTREDKIKYGLVTMQNDINFVMLFRKQFLHFINFSCKNIIIFT